MRQTTGQQDRVAELQQEHSELLERERRELNRLRDDTPSELLDSDGYDLEQRAIRHRCAERRAAIEAELAELGAPIPAV